MTLKELQKLKAELKTAIGNNFSNSVVKSEREIYLRILELLSTLEKSGGNIALTESNLKIADLIKDELPKIVKESSYTKAVEEFITGINEQKLLVDRYISSNINSGIIDLSNYTSKNTGERLTNELIEKLKEVGFKVNNMSVSETSSGVSRYVNAYAPDGTAYKFRVSDHSVTNINRMREEFHVNGKTIGKKIVDAEKKAFPERFVQTNRIYESEKYLKKTDKIISEKIQENGAKIYLIEREGVVGQMIRKTSDASSGFASAVFDQTKRNTIDLLVNATPETGFLKSLENIIDVAVRSGQSWKETVELVREYAIGKEDAGKLNQYSKQVAYDAIAINDRAYTSAIADELESEWFLYAGGELPTSRVFCQDRVGKFFHYKEIESWASEDWAGKNDETTEQTIYEYLGGWNCQHTLIPVTIEMVPQDVIDRNIENGNYTPVKN